MGMDESYWDSGDYVFPIITFLQKEIRGLTTKVLLLRKWRLFMSECAKLEANAICSATTKHLVI